MGVQSRTDSNSPQTDLGMKLLVAVCLLGAALAKAEPEPSYGYYGYAPVYVGYYGKRSADAEPAPYYGGYGYGGYRGYYGKRSGDAEPAPYYGGYGYGGYRGYY